MDSRKPFMVVIFIQLIYTGLYVISKAALDGGLSPFVFVFYRQAAATILLVPLAIIFGRKSAPPISFRLLAKMFMHAFLGITLSLNVYNVSLRYTSATVASATTNSVPVITFLLAVLLRIEPLKLKSLSGIAKVLGILLCLAGIGIIAFYEGPHLRPLSHHQPFSYKSGYSNQTPTDVKKDWVKGTFIMISANTAWSLWLVLQAFILKDYPSKLLFTTLECFFSSSQSFFVAMAFERNISHWKLRFDTGLLAVAYSGFIVTGVSFYLQTWCIEKKGPVFLAMSNPFTLIFTIICSSIFLGEVIKLGSVLGGIFMIGGLYGVLWGKSKDIRIIEPSIEDGKECVREKEIVSPFHQI